MPMITIGHKVVKQQTPWLTASMYIETYTHDEKAADTLVEMAVQDCFKKRYTVPRPEDIDE